MGQLNVNPADLLRVAADYAELHARAATISPQAAVEVQRISATHGPMGYPVAVGIVTNLARQQAALDAKSAQFGQHSQRFTEHAAAYRNQDRDAAKTYVAPADLLDYTEGKLPPLPVGRVICKPMLGGFRCSEFLPGGMVYHWLSPADLSGYWPDFPD
ncbi:hypothetical protein [Mycobacterium sp. SMC-13]|uniref:hypothetical protein n=1 Tax=Mycobacterium sp. SMC-13 TaxID=3381626 RepID=UPI0038769FA7